VEASSNGTTIDESEDVQDTAPNEPTPMSFTHPFEEAVDPPNLSDEVRELSNGTATDEFESIQGTTPNELTPMPSTRPSGETEDPQRPSDETKVSSNATTFELTMTPVRLTPSYHPEKAYCLVVS
jgi:hypothetical protein